MEQSALHFHVIRAALNLVKSHSIKVYFSRFMLFLREFIINSFYIMSFNT